MDIFLVRLSEFISLIIMIAIFAYSGVWLVEHHTVGWAIGTATAVIIHNIILFRGATEDKLNKLEKMINELKKDKENNDKI